MGKAVALGRGDEATLDGAQGFFRHGVGSAGEWRGRERFDFRWTSGIDDALGIEDEEISRHQRGKMGDVAFFCPTAGE